MERRKSRFDHNAGDVLTSGGVSPVWTTRGRSLWISTVAALSCTGAHPSWNEHSLSDDASRVGSWHRSLHREFPRLVDNYTAVVSAVFADRMWLERPQA